MAKVYFDKENLTIQIDHENGGNIYYIDLEECKNSAQLLDWIFQIIEKTWCTPQIMFDILKCIDDACHEVHGNYVQGVYCPWGKSKQVNWKKPKKQPEE